MESKDWSGFEYFSPDFSLPECRYHSGFETPADLDLPGPNPLADMDPPFADLDPPTKLSF